MTRDRLNIALCAVITTVAECPDAPQGIVYAGLNAQGYTLDDYYTVQGLMLKAGLAETTPGPCLRLTAAGLDMAAKINGFGARQS